MDYRFKNYRRRQFENWKQKVRKRLPEITIAFYNAKLSGMYIPYETEKMLGAVIRDINNPYYSIQDDRMNLITDTTSEISAIVILEIMVNKLFAFVNVKCVGSHCS